MGTKDSLYMQDKGRPLCKLCKYSIYDVLGDSGGWNCSKRESGHFTNDWDLPVDIVTSCNVFVFAVPILKKIVEDEIKEAEAKCQMTLEDF